MTNIYSKKWTVKPTRADGVWMVGPSEDAPLPPGKSWWDMATPVYRYKTYLSRLVCSKHQGSDNPFELCDHTEAVREWEKEEGQ